jgi:hypothetical protein
MPLASRSALMTFRRTSFPAGKPDLVVQHDGGRVHVGRHHDGAAELAQVEHRVVVAGPVEAEIEMGALLVDRGEAERQLEALVLQRADVDELVAGNPSDGARTRERMASLVFLLYQVASMPSST